jgi:DNA recombination protein RmuC
VVVVCLAVGAALGWLAARLRAAADIARLEATVQARRDGEERLEQSLRTLSYEATAQSQEAVARAVAPLHDALRRYEQRVAELEHQRVDAYAELREQVRSMGAVSGELRTETRQLVAALRAPQVRGRWGEMQLRRVVEMAGMVEHCDFTAQTTVHTDDGRLRPDVLVRLPGGKLVVVDSKVPLDAFLTAQEAKTEPERDAALAHHARQTREHVTKLASKGYQSQFDGTPELVVMFVPSEGIYHAALAADPALLDYGVKQQVLIATPTTLIGLLRAIHYGWRQELMAESAREIAETGRELHRRLAVFAEPFAKVGRQLGSAVHAYNDAVGSFDRRVVPQLRRIEAAGAASARQPAQIDVVEELPRPLTAGLEPAEDGVPRLKAGLQGPLDEVA